MLKPLAMSAGILATGVIPAFAVTMNPRLTGSARLRPGASVPSVGSILPAVPLVGNMVAPGAVPEVGLLGVRAAIPSARLIGNPTPVNALGQAKAAIPIVEEEAGGRSSLDARSRQVFDGGKAPGSKSITATKAPPVGQNARSSPAKPSAADVPLWIINKRMAMMRHNGRYGIRHHDWKLFTVAFTFKKEWARLMKEATLQEARGGLKAVLHYGAALRVLHSTDLGYAVLYKCDFYSEKIGGEYSGHFYIKIWKKPVQGRNGVHYPMSLLPRR